MSRLGKRRLGDWGVAVVVALIAIVVTWGAAEVRRQGDQLDRQAETVDVLAQALADEQSNAEAAGIDPVAPDAEDLIDDPEYTPTEIPVAPTDAQVREAVEAYFLDHPVEDGEDASPAQITAAVINYLTEHPPEPGDPGPAPTPDQILSAVGAYLSEHPPPAGPPGEDGEDGHTPTAEEIQAELAAYFVEHPVEMCDPGWVSEAITVLTTEGPTDITTCVRQEEN
jgi:hypothetical protein